jgi:N-acetylneuraminic acid mutarotase
MAMHKRLERMLKIRLRLIGLIALSLVLALSIIRCGGNGGDEGEGSGTAPSISGLSYSPTSVYVNEGGGQTDIVGTFDFTDPDGNLSSLVMIVLDSGGQTLQTSTIAIAGVAGLTSGTIQGAVTIPTLTAGNFTVQIYVTDTAGLRSNTIEFVFPIREFPWTTKIPMPTPRLEFSSAVVNGKIYIIGGRDANDPNTPKQVVSTVEIYDPATDSWATGPSLPTALANQMTIAVNGKIYAIGGNEQFTSDTKDVVQELDPMTPQWTLKTPMPNPIASAAVTVNNGLIYIAGGEGPGVIYNSLHWYDPVTDMWSAGSPMSQVRTGPGGATIDSKILVYGGYNSTYIPDAGYLKSVESYDPVMDSWSARADGNPRRDFGIAVHDNLMYVFGGNNSSPSLDWVNAYDNATNQWTAKTAMPSSLGFVRAETVGDKIYIFDTNSTLEYTPANDIL